MGEEQRCRVLIVEDEAAISVLMEDMLLDLGVEIVGPASRLDPALQLACEAGLEAAILDINIGGVQSYPVADVLRSRGIPVIFATGYGASVLPERFRSCISHLTSIGSARPCTRRWPRVRARSRSSDCLPLSPYGGVIEHRLDPLRLSGARC
jgi:CheY-like chemotaxis protein